MGCNVLGPRQFRCGRIVRAPTLRSEDGCVALEWCKAPRARLRLGQALTMSLGLRERIRMPARGTERQ